MKTIEEKFEEWFSKEYPANLLKDYNEEYSIGSVHQSFKAGYETAELEYEEKLKRAVEVIKFYADKENWTITKEQFDCHDDYANTFSPKGGSDMGKYIEGSYFKYTSGQRARDFLKEIESCIRSDT